MLKAIILIIVFFIYAIHAELQKATITEILKTVEKDYFVKIQNERIEFLSTSSSFMPVIDDIELRIRNTAYQFNKQRYTLRLEPRGFGETKASKNLYMTNQKFHQLKKELAINQLLENRYMLVIECLYRQVMLKLYSEMIVLYEDKIKVLKSKIGSVRFDFNELLDTEDKYTKLKFENIERERGLSRLKKEIKGYLLHENFIEIDTTGFIDIDYISTFVKNTTFSLDTNNVYLAYNHSEYQFAESRFNLETAESKRYVTFFEMSYDHEEMVDELLKKKEFESGEKKKPNYNLDRAYMFSVGFRIPFVNVDRHDINRRKIAVLSARYNYEELKKSLQERIDKDTEDIRVLVTQYEFLEARKNDVNSESSLKRYLEMEGVDPTMLLSIKEDIIANDIDKEKIKFDIFRNFIRVIDVTGQISQKPLKNYLTKNQEIMSQ